MIRDSFITWSWILWSSGSSPHAFGRTKTSTRKIRPVRVCWLTLNVFSCSIQSDFCRYGFLALFASTNGGVTRVYPNMWVTTLLVLSWHYNYWRLRYNTRVCVCVSGLLNHGTRTPSLWTQTFSVAVWTTKATSSERQHEPVSPINYKH